MGSEQLANGLGLRRMELISEMMTRYITSADAFMVVYSVGSRKSFEHAVHLFSQIAKIRGVNSVENKLQIARLLVAAKCDSDYREVSPDEGNTLSAQLSCSFAEVSAKMNINIPEVFEEMVSQRHYIETMESSRRRNQQLYGNSGSSWCCFL
nr:Ras domain containing protein [Haemonchus contortus]